MDHSRHPLRFHENKLTLFWQQFRLVKLLLTFYDFSFFYLHSPFLMLELYYLL